VSDLDPVGRPVDPMNVGRAAGLRQQQREQRQRRRKNLRLTVAAALVAVIAVVAGVVILAGGGEDPITPDDKRTQRTLLLMVKGANGAAVSSALIAHEPEGKAGAVVLVPPQVIATIPGRGAQPFSRAEQQAGAAGARNALSDLMGVVVDGSWVLDRATFARLVDQLGGIEADIDVTVLSGRTVVLQPGRQHVDGARAFAYMTYLAPGEQEQSRLARLQGVLDGVVQAWPGGGDALIKSLGAGSKLSLSPTSGAAILAGLKGDDAAQQLQYRSLPVIKLDTGTDAQRFRIDADATRALVDDLLAQSIPPGSRASGNRVLVLNGVGTPGLGEKVRAKLVPAGFVFVGSRNAPSFGHKTTTIYVKEATPAGQALGARVAKALGVRTNVQVSDQIGTLADVVVIVGKDFKGA